MFCPKKHHSAEQQGTKKMPELLCPEDKNRSLPKQLQRYSNKPLFLLKNAFRIDVGMAKVNPCGCISKIVFSSQKPISSSKSKTFFFLFFFLPATPFQPWHRKKKVPFSKFFFASDFNNVPCFLSSCRERCSLQMRRSTDAFYDGKMCTSHQIMRALHKPWQRLCFEYPALENKLHSVVSHY